MITQLIIFKIEKAGFRVLESPPLSACETGASVELLASARPLTDGNVFAENTYSAVTAVDWSLACGVDGPCSHTFTATTAVFGSIGRGDAVTLTTTRLLDHRSDGNARRK